MSSSSTEDVHCFEICFEICFLCDVGCSVFSAAAPLTAQECPTVDALRKYKPPEATRVLAMDGSRVADLSPERRVVVPLQQVPSGVWNGFVAVEDRRFWQHEGVDLRGIGRAI